MTKKLNFAEAYKEQKSAGVDILNPMANLITADEQPKNTFVPEFHVLERRDRRVQLVFPQSLYDKVKRDADRIGISFNEYVIQLCTKATQ